MDSMGNCSNLSQAQQCMQCIMGREPPTLGKGISLWSLEDQQRFFGPDLSYLVGSAAVSVHSCKMSPINYLAILLFPPCKHVQRLGSKLPVGPVTREQKGGLSGRLLQASDRGGGFEYLLIYLSACSAIHLFILLLID